MTNPLGLPALISPYVGGKAGARYFIQAGGAVQSRICDRLGFYDSILETFVGSGAGTFQHFHGIPHAIVGDVDPGVGAVWECWGNPEYRRAVEELIVWWKKRILDAPAAGFEQLKDLQDNRFSVMSPPEIAAAYLTIKRLVFGGVLRCNKAGALNVALSADKLSKFLQAGRRASKRRCTITPSLFEMDERPEAYWGWQHQWPDNGIQSVTFRSSWQGAVQALADSDYSNALVVIDPPYYSPKEWVEERKDGSKRKSKMTPAYRNHRPQTAGELALCLDCLDAVLDLKNVGRIVVFNYWSKILDDMIQDLLIKHHRFDFHVSNLGPLGGMNNAQKFHGRDTEAVWEIGGQRMFRDHDAVQQLALV